ncbi:regulatory protein pocR [Sorangium cellulosum]|uniref:Regulatory protein pocR n=1 Tax=Sorangium cellulosum TaxID=56 RepID=A0A4P2Q4Q0_SORCE|nr:AraC family transcriptional regulator [Sorangium cellulosum]AUX23988.1 regulatory protein pocR [Sorangium cellulosum]
MLLGRDTLRNLCRARDLLSEVRESRLSIEDVARAAAISPYHFIRQFEAVFGVTPHQYRIRRRLDLAKELLAAGRHSVTEVCMEVGFSSLGSFSALFAQRIGVPPSAYRRRLRAMVQVPGKLPWELVPGCLPLMGRLPPDAFRSFREA